MNDGGLLLGVDPGRSKTGLALTDAAGQILAVQVVPTAALAQELRAFTAGRSVRQIALGDGTSSAAAAAVLRTALPEARLSLIPEQHSTEEARALYWQVNRPAGWRRLVPLGLLMPPEPLDGYAAVILARRFLQNI